MRNPRFAHSLRTRVAFGVALPVLVALSSLSLVHYWRERQMVEDQIRLTASQVGQALAGSLRHAMMRHDPEMLISALADVGATNTFTRIRLVNLSGQVTADSDSAGIGQMLPRDGPGCIECHRFTPETRPQTAILSVENKILRVASPIANEPACGACHAEPAPHLGVVLIDAPLSVLEVHLLEDMKVDLAVSGVVTLLVTASVYLLVHWLVVRRVEAFRKPLADYAGGNFASRLPARQPGDEISLLASAFNRMADELDRHAREEAKRSELRRQAIVEERERIARELHDGVAQMLVYVNSKAMAIRLLLEGHKTRLAREYVLQIEEASQRLLVDVRQAILGLKMAGQITAGLIPTLRDYAAHFSRISSLPVEVSIAPEIEGLALAAETEAHLLRIAQEALSNVRKHAFAARASVTLQTDDGAVKLTVGDDGRGFDPASASLDRRRHLGLCTMRERAEAVGGSLRIESAPGAGTQIVVTLPFHPEEKASDARADCG